MSRKKCSILISAVVLGILLILWNLPLSSEEAIGKQYKNSDFAMSSLIQEVDMDENRFLCLYINSSGQLDAAVTKNILGFYRVEQAAGHLVGDPDTTLRVQMHMSALDKGNGYIAFGMILDDQVAEVVYNSKALEEFVWCGTRYFYDFGPGEIPRVNYQLYDGNGNELEPWRTA